jgi:cytosine/adenosine deaminase-related metal-dependent hydrolase
MADMLNAATVGGATAFRRDDLGRVAAGKKADLVLVDLTQRHVVPARDPRHSFIYYAAIYHAAIYHAADRAVRDVFVDGSQVVADGVVVTLDQADRRLAAAQRRMLEAAPDRDYRRRTAAEISPLSLPQMD